MTIPAGKSAEWYYSKLLKEQEEGDCALFLRRSEDGSAMVLRRVCWLLVAALAPLCPSC